MSNESSPAAGVRPYNLDDFFREARARNLTVKLDDVPSPVNPLLLVSKALDAGEHVAASLEQLLAALDRVGSAATLVDDGEHDEQSLAAAEKELDLACEARNEHLDATADVIAKFRERAAKARQADGDLVPVDQVWSASGGHPDAATGRPELLGRIRLMGELCEDLAMMKSQEALAAYRADPHALRRPLSHRDALLLSFIQSRVPQSAEDEAAAPPSLRERDSA